MKKIIEYRRIVGNWKLFDDEINHAIKDGWQPLGGISSSFDSEEGETYCYQAMVKYEEDEK